jgi:hypothetical protein
VQQRSDRPYCFASIHRIRYIIAVMHVLVSACARRDSTDPCWQAPPMRRAAASLGAALLLLAGCAATDGSEPAQAAAAAARAPADPLVAFASQATPGTTSSIVLADGRPATVRVARAYIAASGRECREVLVGTGTVQRAQLVCQGEGGAWVQPRPLLRGGGILR